MSETDAAWRWVCAFYGEVEGAFLELQERYGVDVIAALVACWLADRGASFDCEAISRARRVKQAACAPARGVRVARRAAAARAIGHDEERAAAWKAAARRLLEAEIDLERTAFEELLGVLPARSGGRGATIERWLEALGGVPACRARAVIVSAWRARRRREDGFVAEDDRRPT